MNTPVWLLDVDGVINADRPGWGAAPRRAYAYADGVEWRLRWAPALIDRIRALHTSGLVEVRWCTSWCPHADQVERLVGLPLLARALTDDPVPGGQARRDVKLAAAWDVINAGRPLIWTDDDAIPLTGTPQRDALDALADAGRVLLVVPNPRRGLQPTHLDAIDAFTVDVASQVP